MTVSAVAKRDASGRIHQLTRHISAMAVLRPSDNTSQPSGHPKHGSAGERLTEQDRFRRCLILRILVRRFLRIIGWLVAIQAIFVGLFAVTLLSGSWVWPGYPTFVRIAVIVFGVFLPIVLCLIGLHDPRTAARFGLPLAVLTFIPLFSAIGGSYDVIVGESGHLGVPLAISLLVLAIPVTFWRFAARFGWPVPLPRSLWSIIAGNPFSSSVALLAVLAMVGVGSLSLMPWLPPVGDCSGRPLLDERGVPRGVDFTAKIILVGPRFPLGILRERSLWSLARVHERFGPRSFKVPQFVVLRGFFEAADQSREYFVESTAGSDTVLGHLVPVVEPLDCGHTALLEDAGAWIRILREGAPKSGARLIGRVYVGVPYDHRGKRPAPGTHLNLDGTTGTITSIADADGIYDFRSVPPGTYTLHAIVTEPNGRSFSETQSLRLTEGEARDWDVYAR
jgi:hypothetical protein